MPNSSRRRVVLDTDTYNEVDDQFALAHLLMCPELVELEAVYAAPFHNDRSSGPAEGMELSYKEILNVLELVAPEKLPEVFRGSTAYLPDAATPVQSEAAADLVERAMASTEVLHVVAIAAITNVAAALLMEPRIAGRIKVIWLGGHAPYWWNTNEFNLRQDKPAARVLLDSEAPLLLVPCMPVASHLSTSTAELEKHLEPFSKLGAYLTDIVRHYYDNSPGRSKIIWDMAASAYVVEPKWVSAASGPSPVLNDDLTWASGTPSGRRTIDVARRLDRDAIFADFFARAARSKGAK